MFIIHPNAKCQTDNHTQAPSTPTPSPCSEAHILALATQALAQTPIPNSHGSMPTKPLACLESIHNINRMDHGTLSKTTPEGNPPLSPPRPTDADDEETPFPLGFSLPKEEIRTYREFLNESAKFTPTALQGEFLENLKHSSNKDIFTSSRRKLDSLRIFISHNDSCSSIFSNQDHSFVPY